MTQRLEITVEGYNKQGSMTGKVTRILNGAHSRNFIVDSVGQVKSSIKVGQCGRHVIKVSDGKRVAKRTDMARRGAKAATVGKFVVKNV